MISAAGHTVDGLSYLEFVAPGLMAATVLQNATGESLWPVLAGFKWMRFYDGMAPSPMSPDDVYVGNLIWIAMRFTRDRRRLPHRGRRCSAPCCRRGGCWPSRPPCCAPSPLAAPLIAFAATQETDHGFPLIMRFLTLPMFLFSGTFFPLSQLPAVLRPLAWVLPLWHGVELCRDATTGTLGPAGWSGRGRPPGRAGRVRGRGLRVGHPHLHPEAGRMTVADPTDRRPPAGDGPAPRPRVDAPAAGRLDVAAAAPARAQHRGLARHVADLPLGDGRAGLLPVLHRHRRRASWSATSP